MKVEKGNILESRGEKKRENVGMGEKERGE
jgi:hypothetical protein